MITVRADTRAFQKAMAEFAVVARKDLATVTREQAKILVGHVIAVTPPAASEGQAMTDRGVVALDAKKRGENRIAADIAKLFPTTRASEDKIRGWIRAGVKAKVGGRQYEVRDMALTLDMVANRHRYARSPQTGRTRVTLGANIAWSRAAMVRQYIRQVQAKVGLLESGWVAAADELRASGRAVPAWIRRHGRRGGRASVRDDSRGVQVEMVNEQRWFPAGMDRRFAVALRRREAGLLKAMQAILERRAAKANRDMRSA